MRRLKGRNTETDEEIAGRVARLEYELSKIDEYDYVLVNDDFDRALAELEDIIDGKKVPVKNKKK